jgi:hypothetical protein
MVIEEKKGKKRGKSDESCSSHCEITLSGFSGCDTQASLKI